MLLEIVPTRSDERALKSLKENILRAVPTIKSLRVDSGKIYIEVEGFDLEALSRIRGVKTIKYEEKTIKGFGGLPVGYSGKALMMFSGGFDSPVASWLLWNSGFSLDFVHFNLAGPVQVYHMGVVLKELYTSWGRSDDSRLYIVDFRNVAREIIELVDRRYKQIVLKRAMYKVSEMLAERINIDVIATGESVGQVSSQTLHSLAAIEEALKEKIVLRPLAGLDKEEIINISKRIGLYELSKNVGEYCALVAGKVVTRPKLQKTLNEEKKIEKLLEESLESIEEYDLREFDPRRLLPYEDLEIDFVPYNAVLVDARSTISEDVPGAIRMEEVNPEDLKDRVVVVFCEDGIISREIALELRNQGILAYSFRGGFKRLREKFCIVI
ncbi:MAG: tRNA 4-thiouridine(8) synthase ThiI [Thermoplasmata archaeon]|nr:tRNA 4-thiouridine(8) synthase ThiI [Euryarchaeota archaeon]RLF66558.1 MAG: tRNA 4-thiouridine(8) synthase ThiI [Thermoplasmata archaeon]